MPDPTPPAAFQPFRVSWTWTIATLVAGLAATLAAWLLALLADLFGILGFFPLLALLFLPGYIAGYIQAHALPFPTDEPKRWAVATSAGSIAAVLGLLTLTLAASVGAPLSALRTVDGGWFSPLDIVGGGLVGAIFGLLQSLILREYSRSAWWWIVASASGVVGASVVGSTTYATTHQPFLAGLLGLLAYGLITGIALPSLMRHPK